MGITKGRYVHHNPKSNLWFDIVEVSPDVIYKWCAKNYSEKLNGTEIENISDAITRGEYVLSKSGSFNNLYQKLNAG